MIFVELTIHGGTGLYFDEVLELAVLRIGTNLADEGLEAFNIILQ